jgi:DNA polymerase delta subunit 3
MLRLTCVEQMEGMSEDEGDPDDAPEVKFDEEKTAASRKAREDREEKLRQMMEVDGWFYLSILIRI